jgi:RNA polymerase sigma-70 factor (TIGR02957 family)
MSAAELYAELRPQAFAVAYRMLGSVSEAEDVVQEAFLRLHNILQRDEVIQSPGAYMTTLVTRLAIDHLRSARVRREGYVGEWLPEPIATESTPAEQSETTDSLSLAFLMLLERLTPQQRAAFLLREVFEYSYAEVAEILGTGVDSTRHLVARARKHLRAGRPRRMATAQERDALAVRFIAAAQGGDLSSLEALLMQDVVMRVDGGGKVPARTQPVNGRAQVTSALSIGLAILERRDVRIQIADVNGQAGALALDAAGGLVGVLTFDALDGQIQAINIIVNPDKLQHLGQTRDLGAMFRRAPRGLDADE